MNQILEQTCPDCHFLARYVDNKPVEVDIIQRGTLGEGRTPDNWGNASIGCYRCEWHELNSTVHVHRFAELKKNRRALCFFWKYQPGMSFHTAEIKEERAEDRQAMVCTRWMSIIAIFIAGIGLLWNIIQFLIKIGGCVQAIPAIAPTPTPVP